MAGRQICVKEKSFVAITRSDFAKLNQDIQFLDNALRTELGTYQNYFRERFAEGLSIRRYAYAHQLNRGSVDHLQKKFFCPGSSAESAGQSRANMPTAEAKTKLN